MKSPDGRYEVKKSRYTEVRMGSPEFGKLTIEGCSVNLRGRRFGHPVCFSPDSRYLAIQELKITPEGAPDTRLLLIDLAAGRQKTIGRLSGGFLTPIAWTDDVTLEYELLVCSMDGDTRQVLVHEVRSAGSR